MKRGRRPPIGLALVWAFFAGVWTAFAIVDHSPTNLACAFGFAVLGPISWFVGLP